MRFTRSLLFLLFTAFLVVLGAMPHSHSAPAKELRTERAIRLGFVKAYPHRPFSVGVAADAPPNDVACSVQRDAWSSSSLGSLFDSAEKVDHTMQSPPVLVRSMEVQTEVSFPALSHVFTGTTYSSSPLADALRDNVSQPQRLEVLPCFIHGFCRSYTPVCSFCAIAASYSFSLAPEWDQSASQCNSQVFDGLLDEDEIVDTFLARMLHPASEPLVPQTGSEFGCSLYTDAALRLQHWWRSRPSKVEGVPQCSHNNFHLFTPDIIGCFLANMDDRGGIVSATTARSMQQLVENRDDVHEVDVRLWWSRRSPRK